MEVRPISIGDIDSVVSIHLSAFKGFFLSDLGPAFLHAYYYAFLRNERSVFIGCFENGRLLGFSAASTISNGFNYSLVKSNILLFLRVGICVFLSSPKAIWRLIQNFNKSDNSVNDKKNYAELYSLGVLAQEQGRGIGKTLLDCLVVSLKEKSCSELSLTTDKLGNENTLSFYQKNGFEIMYNFNAFPSREMYRLIKVL